jgi:2'-5' RNA ligase
VIRLFFAINLPPESRARIAAESQALRDAAPSVAWVRTPLLHITVKFLGAQDESMVEGLTASAAGVAAHCPPLRLSFAQYGAFPNLQRPRVVWLGMTSGADAMTRVATELDRACVAHGVPEESRPFKAHLTLGRVRKELSRAERAALADAAVRCSSQETAVIQCLELMRSDLGPGGSRYTTVATLPLGGS